MARDENPMIDPVASALAAVGWSAWRRLAMAAVIAGVVAYGLAVQMLLDWSQFSSAGSIAGYIMLGTCVLLILCAVSSWGRLSSSAMLHVGCGVLIALGVFVAVTAFAIGWDGSSENTYGVVGVAGVPTAIAAQPPDGWCTATMCGSGLVGDATAGDITETSDDMQPPDLQAKSRVKQAYRSMTSAADAYRVAVHRYQTLFANTTTASQSSAVTGSDASGFTGATDSSSDAAATSTANWLAVGLAGAGWLLAMAAASVGWWRTRVGYKRAIRVALLKHYDAV